MKAKHFDVVVVGAGVIGACFALRLAKRSDLSIAILEKSSTKNSFSPNLRTLALGKQAENILGDCELLSKASTENFYPYLRMCVWEDDIADALTFNAKEHDIENLGHIADANHLTYIAHQALHAHPQITVLEKQKVRRILKPGRFKAGADSITIELNAESTLRAQLIVAADGASSWVRSEVKILSHRLDYKQKAIVALLAPEYSHQETAWQRFVDQSSVALLPLTGNACSLVWSAPIEQAESLMHSTQQAFCDRLAAVLQHRFGKIGLLSPRIEFHLKSQRAQCYYSPRVVLLGDAAHSIHPLAGQGANLGFKDVEALVDIIIANQHRDIGATSVLAQYQRNRRADNEQMDLSMTALKATYAAQSPLLSSLRSKGMQVVSKSNYLKSVFVKQAIGLQQ